MKDKNVTARIGKEFDKELEEIKQERLNRKIDKKAKSTRRITNLITKHEDWPRIKEDIIVLNLEGKE